MLFVYPSTKQLDLTLVTSRTAKCSNFLTLLRNWQRYNFHRFAHSIFFYSVVMRLTEICEGKTFFRTSATLHTRFAQQIDRKNCYFCLILCVLTPHRLYAFILYIKCIVLLLQLDFALDCFCCFFFVHFAASQCSSFFLFRSVSDSLIWLSAFIILKMDAI